MSCTTNSIYPFDTYRMTTKITSITADELLMFSEGY